MSNTYQIKLLSIYGIFFLFFVLFFLITLKRPLFKFRFRSTLGRRLTQINELNVEEFYRRLCI